MAEGSYEDECMRAELLGVEKPDYDDFLKRQKDKQANEVFEELVDTENLATEESIAASTNKLTGRLDELNTILASTQKRINNFKTSCGSFTNRLKLKMGKYGGSNSSINSQSSHTIEATGIPQATQDGPKMSSGNSESEHPSQRKSDLNRALDNNVDRLDSLIDKAENAHYSMENQRKQMQSFLK